MKIGFIGLGNMGAHMACNLATADHDVTGFDTAARPEGTRRAQSAAETGTGDDVILPVLSDGGIDGMDRGAVGAPVSGDISGAQAGPLTFLADRPGPGWEALFDVVSTASVQGWSPTSHCPAPGIGPSLPADTRWPPHFTANRMRKALQRAMTAAAQADTEPPMGARAAGLHLRFHDEHGSTGCDFSAMLTRFEPRTRA